MSVRQSAAPDARAARLTYACLYCLDTDWAIITIDPTLMMPPDIEFHLPFWLDVSMHLAPSLVLWVDFFCFSPAFPAHVSPFKVYAVVTTVYSSWIEYCSHMNGSFPYPFLNHLG